ncbi:MAG: alanine racemase [Burkholderiales bacterium]|nr:alanine racemase [Burkholderiales bacterium]
MPRPIRAAVSASALAHNLALAKSLAAPAKLWAVVKANAYGHGLLRAAKALAAADGLALLDLAEALRLRAAGERRPLLLLEGFFDAREIPIFARFGLTPVVHCAEQLAMLAKTRFEGSLDVYLKVNSGMNRLGFAGEAVAEAWTALRGMPQVRAITLMTHFADADGPIGVEPQLAWFEELTRGIAAPRSLANSAALVRFAEATRADWVRPGILLYGGSPLAFRTAADLGLRPAMTLASEIIAVQNLEPGERVGYGFAYEAARRMRVGIVACGYADGYPRHAPTGTPVLVAGRRTHVVGRVSMDMLACDLTDIPEAGYGAPVVLWGEGLPVEEVAAAAGTVNYELLCRLAPRVPVIEVP